MLNKKLLMVVGFALVGLVLMGGYNRPYRWWGGILSPLEIRGMNDQSAIKPFTDNSLRTPVPGTVSHGQWDPVPTKMDLLVKPAENASFKNPIGATPESVAEGEALYNVYCISCHGTEMSPDPSFNSPVQKKGMPGANIHLVKNYTDEHIFAVITHGNAIMRRQSYHLSPEERWHVVNYIRSLANKYK